MGECAVCYRKNYKRPSMLLCSVRFVCISSGVVARPDKYSRRGWRADAKQIWRTAFGERFAQAYVACGVAAKAYRKAGYEGEAASRFGLIFLPNLGNSGPQLRICSDFMAVNAEFTRKEAIRHMAEIARQARMDLLLHSVSYLHRSVSLF
jgi:hypothetical protein